MPASSRFDLSGRVALVTGASRGIGSAIAGTLAEHGATVVLSSRKQADLDAEAERINAEYPEKAVAIAAHAGRAEELQRLVDEVIKRFSRIDILVNNAATNPYMGPVLGAELPAWDKTFEVNVRVSRRASSRRDSRRRYGETRRSSTASSPRTRWAGSASPRRSRARFCFWSPMRLAT